jgi:uncharacterized damage-inducible protein DinB
MSTTELLIKGLELSRTRTLGLLEKIEAQPAASAALAWRPGPGRAHIGWQLMHIAITEEIFASERLAPQKAPAWHELWPRFRGGSTPDDDVPSTGRIREVLSGSRQRLLATLRELGDQHLDDIPEAMRERGLTLRDVFFLLAWHEAHHHGQAHLTFNLYQVAAQ